MRSIFLLFLATAAAGQEERRPNFVVVLVDDLRWDTYGAAGHPFVRTPNIDRLAREGVTFRNAFVTTPLCSPSRASFLTGLYARQHGVLVNNARGAVVRTFLTFPRLLEADGYDTAFIGKWHMGEDDAPRPGFTHWVSFHGQGIYRDPELNINGRRERHDGYLTDLLNFFAVDFVRTAAHGSRPFLLVLAHKAVHAPFNPPERHRSLYQGVPVPCSPGCTDTLVDKPALTRPIPGTRPVRRGDGPPAESIRDQLRLLSSVDEGLGEVLRVLSAEGVLDDTVIVLTSDNGYFYREHGLGDKRWAYEESIRVPLLLRYPPVASPGARVDALVLNVDLGPTLLDLSGLGPPDKIAHGRSVRPLLTGEESAWRDAFVAEYYEESSAPRVPTWEAIRTERFKYIRYPELGARFDELYDLANDPFELSNRIRDPALSSTRDALRREMERLFAFPPRS